MADVSCFMWESHTSAQRLSALSWIPVSITGCASLTEAFTRGFAENGLLEKSEPFLFVKIIRRQNGYKGLVFCAKYIYKSRGGASLTLAAPLAKEVDRLLIGPSLQGSKWIQSLKRCLRRINGKAEFSCTIVHSLCFFPILHLTICSIQHILDFDHTNLPSDFSLNLNCQKLLLKIA